MRSLAIGLSLVAFGCAHQAAEPTRELASRPVEFKTLCRAASPQVQLTQDASEGSDARRERADRVAADAKAALVQLDQAALHDPDLVYGREREDFLKAREQCANQVVAMELLRDGLVAQKSQAAREELTPEPAAKPVKQAKAKTKAKHRRAMRMAAAASAVATR